MKDMENEMNKKVKPNGKRRLGHMMYPIGNSFGDGSDYGNGRGGGSPSARKRK